MFKVTVLVFLIFLYNINRAHLKVIEKEKNNETIDQHHHHQHQHKHGSNEAKLRIASRIVAAAAVAVAAENENDVDNLNDDCDEYCIRMRRLIRKYKLMNKGYANENSYEKSIDDDDDDEKPKLHGREKKLEKSSLIELIKRFSQCTSEEMVDISNALCSRKK